MPVYADVLFVVNAFINYLLLIITMKIMSLSTGRLRLLSGSFTAGAFAFKIFLPQLPFIAEVILRLIVPAIVVYLSFSFKSVISCIKAYVTYLVVSFLFGGFIISVIYFINPDKLLYSDGVVYYDLSFISIVLLSTLAFSVISLAEKLLSKRSEKQNIYQLTINHNNINIKGRALADSGNCLRDAFSKTPVIIADYSCVKSISPEGISEYLKEGSINKYNEPLRIIPVSTVSGTGLLPAFTVQTVYIKGINKEIKRNNVYIAVSKERLCHGEFEFLLNNSILEEDGNEKAEKSYKKAYK